MMFTIKTLYKSFDILMNEKVFMNECMHAWLC